MWWQQQRLDFFAPARCKDLTFRLQCGKIDSMESKYISFERKIKISNTYVQSTSQTAQQTNSLRDAQHIDSSCSQTGSQQKK